MMEMRIAWKVTKETNKSLSEKMFIGQTCCQIQYTDYTSRCLI
jgi:hypothetical protein